MAARPAAGSFINRILCDKPPNHKPSPSISSHLSSGHLRKAVSLLFSSPFPFPFSLYSHLFRLASLSTSSLLDARKLESHLLTFTPDPPTFLLNRAIECYSKCDSLADALDLFDEMPRKDGGSWNAVISAYVRAKNPAEALWCYVNMNRAGFLPNEVTFASVIASCGATLDDSLARQVHGVVLRYGFGGNVILGSSIVDVYGKCGAMGDARRAFEEIQRPNEVSWNIIVRRYVEVGEGMEEVMMFFRMHVVGVGH